ncbi:mannose-1-phosphate guanylyltransferase/mannose-6-phosphate isomerase [Cupriavidus basilensis]|uniref:mannose-1-phosphate guanylyltransferase/mannose-6-phosphate isomerase n=1 Tax=Cupriavidus basilensis TaxID=68895 RepID=UPI0002D7CBD4|nr:mannose-1-phosphate guanylyltransferase/mannose-6-phosphate isomerase [Cupriavidus basilensis]
MEAATVITPVVLCGGSGTRLWPLSREGHPKQLLKLLGARSLLQDTLLRVREVTGIGAPEVAEQAREIGTNNAAFILEPCSRNTAPAAAAAALSAVASGKDPLLLLLPADHLIRDASAFCSIVEQGVSAALGGAIVTFGIVPTAPAIGYGYIQAGARCSDNSYEVASFEEKPSLPRATQFLSDGNYFWNSGIFLSRASVYIAELEAHSPEILSAVREAVVNGTNDLDFFRLQADSYERCPVNSIDYAVMENTKRARMLPLPLEWSDVGSWDAVWKIGTKTAEGNVSTGDVLTHNTKNCLVQASHRLVAIAGLEDVMVVETPDAVLVVHKDQCQEVKVLVDMVRERGTSEASAHRKVYRPWGSYDAVDGGQRYQVKRITVKPGAKLSLQMHHHRAEHWIVVSGTARIRNGDRDYLLTENQSTYIPIGETHSLENPGRIPLELIEVQSGSYLGEDDIVRFEDIYGRA